MYSCIVACTHIRSTWLTCSVEITISASFHMHVQTGFPSVSSACEITIQYSTIGINFTNTFQLIIQLTNAAVISREKLTMIVYFLIELVFFFPVSFLQNKHRLFLSRYWSGYRRPESLSPVLNSCFAFCSVASHGKP